MNDRKSIRRMSLQSSALVLLAGMSTALVVVDAQNMLLSAVKKLRTSHAHQHRLAPKRLCVDFDMQDDQSVPKHTTLSLWIG